MLGTELTAARQKRRGKKKKILSVIINKAPVVNKSQNNI